MNRMFTRTGEDKASSKSELDPWQVILGHLFELDSYNIPQIIEKTGMVVDWSLTEREDYSHKYRKAAYRPRINSAYNSLSEQDRLRVAYIVASELSKGERAEIINANLERIGWRIEEGHLTTIRADVRELFFPKDTQHDAYLEIRKLFQKAKGSITLVDPYLDSSILIALGTILISSLKIRLLTYKIPSDFPQEACKFLAQHTNFTLEARRSKEFHDRFIVLDNDECWHVGCSIKDAGSKAFMLSKMEDQQNRDALVSQLENSWSTAEMVSL
ncbi:MAG: hypothetical protein MRJ65_06130 [Candidatus Brocadiaceae bacterium]|nr:hypothetical protein [Candidatus Brocadiaceae bacterium]